MKNSTKYALTCFALATLVACGGGGSATPAAAGAGGGGGGAVTLAPSPTAAPTAVLTNSAAAANDTITEVNAGLAAARNGATGAGFQGPLGIQSSALPTGVSISCAQFGAGGSGSIDYDVSGLTGGITSGASITYTYNNCSIGGYTYNGTFRLVYDRFVSASDFAYTSSYQNFTINGNGLTNYAFSGSQSCNYTGGAVSCYYSDGTRGWSSNFTYANGVVNGSYSANYGSGTVRVQYTNYSATSGTARVTGANGAYYEVRRCSATAYTVTYSATGTSIASTYSVGGGCP
jgi:hypothetical protein